MHVGNLLVIMFSLTAHYDIGYSTCVERLVDGISNEMITASSYYGVGFEPWNGRFTSRNGEFGSEGSWKAATNDSYPFIQVQFRSIKTVTGVVTLPRDGTAEYVYQFRVQFRENAEWMYVKEGDRIKNFVDDRPDLKSETTKMFPKRVQARFVRIYVSGKSPSLRFDVLGCPLDLPTSECTVGHIEIHIDSAKSDHICQNTFDDYFLSGKGGVLNHQITASSYSGPYTEPWSGRISNTIEKGNFGWSSKEDDKQPFIQVDFRDTAIIACITTKPTILGFIRSYRVLYKDEGDNWKTLRGAVGNPKILPGNAFANEGAVNTSLPYPLKAKVIRIVPMSYEKKVSMYFDFIGTILTEKTDNSVLGELCRIVRKETWTDLKGNTPCNIQLVRGVPDKSITASSYLAPGYEPYSARYNSSNGWAPNIIDTKPYIQVNLMTTSYVKCILTRKHAKRSEHVRTYTVHTSTDGTHWDKVLDQENNIQIFIGNDGMDARLGIGVFPNPVKIRYIRILPVTFHALKTIRFEIIGCSVQTWISQNTVMNPTIPQYENSHSTEDTSIDKFRLQTTIATSDVQVAGDLETRTAIPVTACNCICALSDTNLTIESKALKTRLKALVKTIKIQKNATAKGMRGKKSAIDERTSSKTIGTVGVCFILFVAIVVILLDIQTIYVSKD